MSCFKSKRFLLEDGEISSSSNGDWKESIHQGNVSFVRLKLTEWRSAFTLEKIVLINKMYSEINKIYKHLEYLYYFNFERRYDVLKSKSPGILLNKNIILNKNETELKMENPTYAFIKTSLALQLIQELQIKNTTVMSWSSGKKKEHTCL